MTIGETYHHKVRMFQKNNNDNNDDSSFQEKNGFLKMKISDFITFLDKKSSLSNSDSVFEFIQHGHENKTSIDLRKTSLYMIDLDIMRASQTWYDDLMKNFRLF